MEKKSENLFLTDSNLLVVQDLSQAHYQILLIILLNKFIKLNANMTVIRKHAKHAELNIMISIVGLNT